MQNVAFDVLPENLRLRKRGVPVHSDSDLGDLAAHLYASDALLPQFRVQAGDVDDETVQRLRGLVRTYLGSYGAFKAQPRFIDKSQSFSIKVPILRAAFPDADFLVISRNPYALCWGRSQGQHLLKAQQLAGRPITQQELLALRSQHWRNSIQIALNDVQGASTMFKRFEDFLLNPAHELGHILNFLRLDGEPARFLPKASDTFPPGSVSTEKWFPMQQDPNAKYLREIPDRDLSVMESEFGELAHKLGYHSPRAKL